MICFTECGDFKYFIKQDISFAPKVTGPRVGDETRTAEDDKDACDLEVMSQSLILPPTDRPYFLLLQGYDQSKARHAAQPYHTAPPDIIPASPLSQHTIFSFIHLDGALSTEHTTSKQKLSVPTQATQ